jgi:hypothetical protein
MTLRAIGVLRATADECERQGHRAERPAIKSELFVISARWHYLAGEAEKLYQQQLRAEADAALQPLRERPLSPSIDIEIGE